MTQSQKLEQLARAHNALQTAADALRKIRDDKTDNHFLCEEARYYLTEIEILISCDHGQAGIDPLIASLEKRINHG